MVNKYSKELGKVMFAKAQSPGARLHFIPVEESFSEQATKSGEAGQKGELNSKRNFDMIKRRTEIRKKLAEEAEKKRGEEVRKAFFAKEAAE